MREQSAQGRGEVSLRSFSLLLSIFFLLFVGMAGTAGAQATISTGSIQGAVTDPSGAVIAKAKLAISNKATGAVLTITTTASGLYTSGPLLPGEYSVRVEAAGFKGLETTVAVQVGVVTPGNFTLQVGATSTTLTVTGTAIATNTSEATIQGVLTAQQIQSLPINGRNYLALAGLEPGVQVQDGGDFDPTKNGYSSVSFAGRSGRSARIDVDGIDISDETVGTVTQNIPLDAIQEFQTEQSTLSPSTELTSSGAVNVVTKSGTNSYHGSFFFLGRSDQLAARIAPRQLEFSRKHVGADFGGPFIKNKLYFFGAWERIQQDTQTPVTLTAPFNTLSGSFTGPFRDSLYMGRLDWQVRPGNYHAFFRYSYEQNRDAKGFLPNNYQPFENVDNAPVYLAGLDFHTGDFTHSLRFGFTKYRNAIGDALAESGAFNPAPGIELSIGPDPFCVFVAGAFCSGINFLVPQKTFQRSLQGKYDGSRVYRSHILTYGFSMNSIKDGGFAAFGAFAPFVNSPFTSAAEGIANTPCASGQTTGCGPFPGGQSNPLNYPAESVLLANGQGFFTERPAFGLPAGGQFDTRVEWYFADSWKARHNLTISGAVRYVRDTGRSDADLPPEGLLNQFGTTVGQRGLGNPIRQPDKNFGGELGVAWAPFGPKTVFRAGTGLFYENVIFNSVLFDRPGRLPTGLFFGTAGLCPNTTGTFTLPSGQVISTAPDGTPISSICGAPIGNVGNEIAAIQKEFIQGTVQAGPASNAVFFDNALFADGATDTVLLYDPNFRTPRSFQVNAGVEHELWRNTVVSADFVRQVATHFLVGVDVNHAGDSRFLDMGGAQAAISATNNLFGCGSGFDSASINCAVTAGATIGDYDAQGLGGPVELTLFGTPCGLVLGHNCAFGGINPNFGPVMINKPIGRSVFDAFQVKLRGQQARFPLVPDWLLKDMGYQISYQLGEFDSLFTDQDFNATLFAETTDFRNPLRFFGPNALDRTHQFSVGAFFQMLGTRVGIVTHWSSNLPQTLTLPCTGSPYLPFPGDVFQNDVTGDGTVCDVLPGTNKGAFGRSVRLSDLNNVITSYSNNFGNQLNNQGQALVAAGLFTPTQLQNLCAVTPSLTGDTFGNCNSLFPLQIPLAPKGQVGISSFFTFDLSLGWTIHLANFSKSVHIPENFVIQPSITIYNLFNRQNFDPGSQLLSGSLTGLPGSVNGTTRNLRTNLITPGSGTFAFGAPRLAEFGAKFTF